MPDSIKNFVAIRNLAETIRLTPKIDENLPALDHFSRSLSALKNDIQPIHTQHDSVDSQIPRVVSIIVPKNRQDAAKNLTKKSQIKPLKLSNLNSQNQSAELSPKSSKVTLHKSPSHRDLPESFVVPVILRQTNIKRQSQFRQLLSQRQPQQSPVLTIKSINRDLSPQTDSELISVPVLNSDLNETAFNRGIKYVNLKLPDILAKSPKIVVKQTLREQNKLQDDRAFERMERQITQIMNS